jgi:hypothetical protein
MVDCEGGYFAGDGSGGALFEKHGKKIKDLPDDGSSKRLETTHLANFIAAVRSRKANDLAAEAREGHVSTACCHLANISYRLGKVTASEGIREAVGKPPELMDAFNRCHEYLKANGVDLEKTRAVLGPWLSFDARQERFVGKLADEANALARREYRKRFEVPKIT